MHDVRSEARIGIFDGHKVKYSITARLKNGVIHTAAGLFLSPYGLHEKYQGLTKELIDVETHQRFLIIISPFRFSFIDGHKYVDALL